MIADLARPGEASPGGGPARGRPPAPGPLPARIIGGGVLRRPNAQHGAVPTLTDSCYYQQCGRERT